MKKIIVKKLTTGSVYQIVLIGSMLSFVPLLTLWGLGGAVLHLGKGLAVEGLWALAIAPVQGVLGAVFFTGIFGSLIALGLWVYSMFWPLELEYEEPLEKKEGETEEPCKTTLT